MRCHNLNGKRQFLKFQTIFYRLISQSNRLINNAFLYENIISTLEKKINDHENLCLHTCNGVCFKPGKCRYRKNPPQYGEGASI